MKEQMRDCPRDHLAETQRVILQPPPGGVNPADLPGFYGAAAQTLSKRRLPIFGIRTVWLIPIMIYLVMPLLLIIGIKFPLPEKYNNSWPILLLVVLGLFAVITLAWLTLFSLIHGYIQFRQQFRRKRPNQAL